MILKKLFELKKNSVLVFFLLSTNAYAGCIEGFLKENEKLSRPMISETGKLWLSKHKYLYSDFDSYIRSECEIKYRNTIDCNDKALFPPEILPNWVECQFIKNKYDRTVEINCGGQKFKNNEDLYNVRDAIDKNGNRWQIREYYNSFTSGTCEYIPEFIPKKTYEKYRNAGVRYKYHKVKVVKVTDYVWFFKTELQRYYEFLKKPDFEF